MNKYDITGMSCAACSARVEKAVSELDGVTSCSVNLLTNSMTVEGNLNSETVIKAVEGAGYGASLQGGKREKPEKEENEITPLKKRLISSALFLIVLMYVSMGHGMWGWYMPPYFAKNPMAIGILQLLLTVAVMIINKKFFESGFKAVLNKAPNMDTLVAMGSGAAFVYSVYNLFEMSNALLNGNINHAAHLMHNLYFESAAMILALITVGKMLEAYSKGKTTNAIRSLMTLAPDTAIIIRDGAEKTVLLSEVITGDIFIVRPGTRIPVDGIITEGSCAIDASALTGESLPIDKNEGDSVSAGTINLSGFIKCRATKVGEDTTLSKIIKMVKNAASTKAPAQKAADKVSGVFVPVVLLISLITLISWLVLGKGVEFALARAISTLVISCPCALGLATPVAIMVGSGVGAKSGILFKTAQSLEETGKIKTAVFDKTGTLTKGESEVTDIIPFGDYTEETLLKTAFALEYKSEHPLAKAILKKGEEKGLEVFETENFEIFPGNGLSANLGEEKVCGGNYDFISRFITVSENALKEAEKVANQGKTPVFFCKGNEFCGIIAIADELKDDSIKAISTLKEMGIETVMLTGDNEKTANAIGNKIKTDKVISGVLPEGKEAVIKELQRGGRVLMVGDGINDAPALTRADIGVAIGAGEDVAIDAAEVVLMNSSPMDVAAAIKLSRATLKNIYENLFWAFIYNMLGIPLAAGVFGLELSPMFAAAAMSMSSFCVVSNALRLNFANIKAKEIKKMKVTLKIEGMMCPHCEARVKSTLEAIDGVLEVIPSHEKKTAEITLSKEISEEVLKSAVEAQGYKVI